MAGNRWIPDFLEEGVLSLLDKVDQIFMKRASITGFCCPDVLEDGPKIEKIMHDWYLEGSLKFKADVTNGLENVLVSYKRMFNGDNVGKTLVKL